MSFILSREGSPDLLLALFIPGLMGLGSGGAYLYFGVNSNLGNEELERLATKLFGYTGYERRAIEHLNGQELYKSMTEQERVQLYKNEYGIDGNYMYRNQTALQAALFILGGLHFYRRILCLGLAYTDL